jgi:hypothetical protein
MAREREPMCAPPYRTWAAKRSSAYLAANIVTHMSGGREPLARRIGLARLLARISSRETLIEAFCRLVPPETEAWYAEEQLRNAGAPESPIGSQGEPS